MASKVRINLQIEDTSPLVREIIGSLKGEKGWTGADPDEVVKVTYVVTAGNVEVINEGIYYSIPTITTAKEGDTAFSDDFRLFVYDEVGARWRLWASADKSDVKVYHNNTLIGDGTIDSPLGVNPSVIVLKSTLNPLLKGVDNGDGTYTFTTIDGSTSFTINSGLSENIYNTDGVLTGNRTVDLSDYSMSILSEDDKEILISSRFSPSFPTVCMLRVHRIDGGIVLKEATNRTSGILVNLNKLTLLTGEYPEGNYPIGNYFLKLIDNQGTVEYSKILSDDIDDSTSTNKFVDQSLVNLISSALQPGDNVSELNNDSGFIESSEKGQPLGVATLDSNGLLDTSQLPPISITEVIAASETTIADFAANSGNYTFQQGDVILIDDGGVVTHYLYKGGTKTDVGEYSELSASQIDWSQVVNTPTTLAGYGITDAGAAAPVQSVNGETGAVVIDADDIDDSGTTNKFVTAAEKADIASALQAGDNISQLNNNSGYVDAAGAASAAPVQSVNSQSGAVVLDADDIDDSATVHKFVTQALINTLNSAVQPGDLVTVATTGNYSDLIGAPTIPDSLDDLSGDSDDITEGTAHLFMTTAERNKLGGIASGAEVNVNADWNAVSGDAQILNKPTLGTAASANIGDFATAMQGALADTAVQPGDLATVATTGAYSDLTGTPAIPNSLDDLSGYSDDISEGTTNLFMTPLERSKLAGIASGAEVNVNADWNAVSGDSEILNKPTLGTASAADTGDFATSAQGSKADTAVQPSDLAQVATSGQYSDLSGTPSIPSSLSDLSGNLDNIADGSSYVKSANNYTTAEKNKLSGIEANADVTDSVNVAAAGATMDSDTDVSGNDWVLDEDDMVSNDATKVPTQQSVKAYVDTSKLTVNNPEYGNQILTDAANISWDMDNGEVATVTITDNRTLSNPTNLKVGTYILIVKQDSVGGRTLDFDTVYRSQGGLSIDIGQDPDAVTIITFVSDGTLMYGASTLDWLPIA